MFRTFKTRHHISVGTDSNSVLKTTWSWSENVSRGLPTFSNGFIHEFPSAAPASAVTCGSRRCTGSPRRYEKHNGTAVWSSVGLEASGLFALEAAAASRSPVYASRRDSATVWPNSWTVLHLQQQENGLYLWETWQNSELEQKQQPRSSKVLHIISSQPKCVCGGVGGGGSSNIPMTGTKTMTGSKVRVFI